MKTLAPLLLLFLLVGCTTAPVGAPSKAGTTKPSAPAQATFSGDADGATTDFMGGEIHCQVHSIDGDTSNANVTLQSGLHTVIAVLTSQGEEYVGVVHVGLPIGFPEARTYRIRAHRRNDAVTVTLVDDCDNLVATSTASLEPQMKFNVFVKQM